MRLAVTACEKTGCLKLALTLLAREIYPALLQYPCRFAFIVPQGTREYRGGLVFDLIGGAMWYSKSSWPTRGAIFCTSSIFAQLKGAGTPMCESVSSR